MRDPRRIDDILARIKTVWEKNPDLRLGQLICNVVPESYVYFIEDDTMITAIEKGYEQINGPAEKE